MNLKVSNNMTGSKICGFYTIKKNSEKTSNAKQKITRPVKQNTALSFGNTAEISKVASEALTNTGKALLAIGTAGLAATAAKTATSTEQSVVTNPETRQIHKYSSEISPSGGVGTLNHQTHFFREPQTDEIVQNYIVERFSQDSEINVVSGACSSGEEAKSYAMMLDLPKDRLHIYGFDISEASLNRARSNISQLIIGFDNNSEENFLQSKYKHEMFLSDNHSETLHPYIQKCKQRFENCYERNGEQYKIPYNEELHKIFNNRDKYEDYKTRLQNALKKPEKVFEYPEYWRKESKAGYIIQPFKAKEGVFDNITFEQGDVLNLERLYRPGSINVLLYRNALYHGISEGTCKLKSNADEIMNTIAKQMNKVVKKDGLVVFERDIYSRCGNGAEAVIKSAMENNGFRQYVHDNNEIENIWIKIEDVK